MKILFAVNGYPPRELAGTELYAHSLAELLRGRHVVSVFCRTVERALPEHGLIRETVDGVEVVRVVNNVSGVVEPERYFSDPATDNVFDRMLDESVPDILHIHHLMGLSAGVIDHAARRGIPVIATLHDYWFICPRFQLVDEAGGLCRGPEGGFKCARDCPGSLFTLGVSGILGKLGKWSLNYLVPSGLQRKLKQMVREGRITKHGKAPAGLFARRAALLHETLEKADKLVAPSGYVKDVFTDNGFSSSRIMVIPHGIQAPLPCTRIPSSVPRFGYIGSLAPLKGVPLLIEAFGRLEGKAELHVHGHGGENDDIIITGLRKLAGDKAVRFHGGYEHAGLGDILAGLDVVVVPSLWPETFGIVIREAMSAGVPVIVSDTGALPEAVEDGVNGLIFRSGDVEDLAGIMQTLVGDPGLLVKLSRGIRPVKDLETHVKEIEALYEDVVHAKVLD